MVALVAAFLVASTRPAVGAPPAGAAAAPAVVRSTGTVAPQTIYTAERVRDPFIAPTSVGGTTTNPFTIEDFNIHNLALRGIMKDSGTDFALFTDAQFGITFILRRGKLYDPKNKPVPGVTGGLNLKQRTAHLMAADGDVQTFKLGQEEEKE